MEKSEKYFSGTNIRGAIGVLRIFPAEVDFVSARKGSAEMIGCVSLRTSGPGLTEITEKVEAVVSSAGVAEGVCTVMIQHTSASLTIQENADPSARRDLEKWLAELVPEGNARFTHTAEGPDDMPSHIKAALTSSTLSIPIVDGRLALGTWQGIYLWEHRRAGSERRCVVHVGG